MVVRVCFMFDTYLFNFVCNVLSNIPIPLEDIIVILEVLLWCFIHW